MESAISAQNSSMTSLSFFRAYSWISGAGSFNRAMSPARRRRRRNFQKKKKKKFFLRDLELEKNKKKKKRKKKFKKNKNKNLLKSRQSWRLNRCGGRGEGNF